jgi:hypothetical protein
MKKLVFDQHDAAALVEKSAGHGAVGGVVAALMVIGSIPFLLGLTVVMPVLGHATWHLYRTAVEPDPNPHPDYQPRMKQPKYAADFPAALFPTRR